MLAGSKKWEIKKIIFQALEDEKRQRGGKNSLASWKNNQPRQ
jgi:hypothetical protein